MQWRPQMTGKNTLHYLTLTALAITRVYLAILCCTCLILCQLDYINCPCQPIRSTQAYPKVFKGIACTLSFEVWANRPANSWSTDKSAGICAKTHGQSVVFGARMIIFRALSRISKTARRCIERAIKSPLRRHVSNHQRMLGQSVSKRPETDIQILQFPTIKIYKK